MRASWPSRATVARPARRPASRARAARPARPTTRGNRRCPAWPPRCASGESGCSARGRAEAASSWPRIAAANPFVIPRASRPLNARVSMVPSSWAARIAALWAGGAPLSGQAIKAVPNCTPLAPSAAAATIPRPSIIPPDAITGTETASAICGTSAIVPTRLSSSAAMKVPRWAPASLPCATIASAPACSSARASDTVVAVPISLIPRSFIPPHDLSRRNAEGEAEHRNVRAENRFDLLLERRQ